MRTWATTAAALLLAADPALANPWSVLGFDGDSIAKGNALTGGAEGAPALFYNPAGLIKKKQRDLRVSYIHGEPLLQYEPQNNPEVLGFDDFEVVPEGAIDSTCGDSETCRDDFARYNSYIEGGRNISQAHNRLDRHARDRAENPRRVDGVTLGMAFPLAIDPEDAFASAGAAAYVPVGPVIYQRLKGPTTPFFLKYDDAPHRIVVDAGGAVEFWDQLRIGLGADILVDVTADPNATIILPPELSIGGIPPNPNLQDIEVFVDGEVSLPPTVAMVGGIQYSPTDWVDIGVSFRDKQDVDVSLESVITLESPFGTRQVPADVVAGGAFNPRQVAGGFAFHPLQGLSIFGDVVWKQWSAYVPPFAIEASVSGLGDAACDVVRSFQDLDDILGAAASVGVELDSETICELIDDAALNDVDINTYDANDPANQFNDTISPGLGISYGPDQWEVSVGYRFDPSPAPEQDGLANILDTDTHIYSGGFSYQVMSFASVGVYAQWRQLTTETVNKSRSRFRNELGTADAYPDAEFTTDDSRLQALEDHVAGQQIVRPGYPGYTVNGSYLSAGLNINVNF